MIKLMTSESVSPSHPDKLCDVIADTLKDQILSQDENARVAIECMCTTNKVVIMGEVTTSAKVDYDEVVRKVIKDCGYTHNDSGFCYNDVDIQNLVHAQSPDIAMGTVDSVGGSGDQGIIFGYACNETKELIPLSWQMARDMTSKCFDLSVSTEGKVLRPDAKSQVTLAYFGDKIVGINTVVVSCSHAADVSQNDVRAMIVQSVIIPILDKYGYDVKDVKHILINPTGAFSVYGPNGDTGLTGRKLVVDQYGGHSAVGGGTMQGKDPTKVDNSAALMARYIAKNIVAAGVSDRCQVQLAYAIGIPQPVSINIEFFNTQKNYIPGFEKWILDNVDCSPRGMIERFSLRRPSGWNYSTASAKGWFGREGFPWEKLDLVDDICALVK